MSSAFNKYWTSKSCIMFKSIDYYPNFFDAYSTEKIFYNTLDYMLFEMVRF